MDWVQKAHSLGSNAMGLAMVMCWRWSSNHRQKTFSASHADLSVFGMCSNVRPALRKLEEAGLVEVVERGVGHRKSVYRLVFNASYTAKLEAGWLAAEAKRQAKQGEHSDVDAEDEDADAEVDAEDDEDNGEEEGPQSVTMRPSIDVEGDEEEDLRSVTRRPSIDDEDEDDDGEEEVQLSVARRPSIDDEDDE
jgi:hypothetical protein